MFKKYLDIFLLVGGIICVFVGSKSQSILSVFGLASAFVGFYLCMPRFIQFLVSLVVKYSGKTENKPPSNFRKRGKFNKITIWAVIFSILGDFLIVILYFSPYRNFLRILTPSISIVSILLLIFGIAKVEISDERMNLINGLPGRLLIVSIVFLSFVLLPFVGRFIAYLFPVYPDA